jgi:hypothetical protein
LEETALIHSTKEKRGNSSPEEEVDAGIEDTKNELFRYKNSLLPLSTS